jgi:hypothetical protein
MTIDDSSMSKASRPPAPEAARWLLLIHQIPAKPAYLRVKIWRRLADIGAVAIKNAVNALPANEETQEDFEWLLREIVAGGGEAMICEARMVEGLTDTEIRALFDVARDEDYHALIAEMRPVADRETDGSSLAAQTARWRKRLSQIAGMDFFGASGRLTAEALLSSIEARLHREEETMPETPPPTATETMQNRVWVTRQGVHVDRIASAWLIRRFIDPQPTFKFVPSKGYVPQPRELRFDMFEAEYTHEGDRCTFEVLCERCGIGDDPALKAIAEIVHEIDLKDDKFDREETPGIGRLIAGIAMANRDDEERIARGSAVFDDLYEFYRRKGDRADGRQRPAK